MEWRNVIPEKERLEQMTHLIFTGYFPDSTLADGTLNTDRHTDTTFIRNLVARADSTDTKVMIMLGGWGNGAGFSAVVADSAKRVKFAQEVADYCNQYGFAGADMDWEFPSAGEFDDYELMMKEFRTEFDKTGLTLTAAIGQNHYDKYTTKTWEYIDWVNVMAYDLYWATAGKTMADNHAPVSVHTDYYAHWEAAGLSKDQIVMGLPFYGRLTTNWGDAKSYEEIYNASAPSHDHNLADGYNYNGPNTIYNKTQFAVANGYGGVMVWEILHDLDYGHADGLHTALIQGVTEGLAGTSVEREVTYDVKIDNRTSLIQIVPKNIQAIIIEDDLMKNLSQESSSYKIVDLKGQILAQGVLAPGEERALNLSQKRHIVLKWNPSFRLSVWNWIK